MPFVLFIRVLYVFCLFAFVKFSFSSAACLSSHFISLKGALQSNLTDWLIQQKQKKAPQHQGVFSTFSTRQHCHFRPAENFFLYFLFFAILLQCFFRIFLAFLLTSIYAHIKNAHKDRRMDLCRYFLESFPELLGASVMCSCIGQCVHEHSTSFNTLCVSVKHWCGERLAQFVIRFEKKKSEIKSLFGYLS